MVGLRQVGALSIAHPGAFDGDRRVGSDTVRHPGRGADDRMMANDRVTAQDRCVGVDDHFVFDGWMPLVSPHHLSGALIAWEAERAQSDALIDLHPCTD